VRGASATDAAVQRAMLAATPDGQEIACAAGTGAVTARGLFASLAEPKSLRSQPPWQDQTNVWRGVTNLARGEERLRRELANSLPDASSDTPHSVDPRTPLAQRLSMETRMKKLLLAVIASVMLGCHGTGRPIAEAVVWHMVSGPRQT
jgi:hypothetical protein